MTSKQGYYPIKKQTTDDVNGTKAGWKHGNEYLTYYFIFCENKIVYVIYNSWR